MCKHKKDSKDTIALIGTRASKLQYAFSSTEHPTEQYSVAVKP
jgi:hypothetical protein